MITCPKKNDYMNEEQMNRYLYDCKIMIKWVKGNDYYVRKRMITYFYEKEGETISVGICY